MAITQWQPVEDIVHWEPFGSLESLQREMNHLFERVRPSGNGDPKLSSFMPPAELEETNDTINLKLEVPGMEAKDLHLEVTDGTVSVKGERKSESKTEEKGMKRSEFRYGSFERFIRLPGHIQTDKVKAECVNGILSVTLPKAEADRHKTVKVKIQ